MTLVVVPTSGLVLADGKYATYLSYGRYLSELAELVGGLRIYAPVFDASHPEYSYYSQWSLDPRACEVVPLPGHPRGTGGTRLLVNYLTQLRVFLRDVGSWTNALVYSPSATASLAALALQIRGATSCTLFTYVWGDWTELSAHLPQQGVIRRFLDPVQRRWIPRQERWLVRASHATLTAGPLLRQKYAGVGRAVSETVPMIDLDGLRKPQNGAARVPGRVLVVGRLAPGKGLEPFLDAMAIVRESTPEVRGRIVGIGDATYVEMLERYRDALDLGESVSFVGLRRNGPELWDEYRQASVLVMPSLSEGFPRVLYEAMALGTPIVSTVAGSVAEVLRDGEHAVLVPSGNVRALADAIQQVLHDDHRSGQRVDAARDQFARLFGRSGSAAQQVAEIVLAAS